MTGKRLSAWRHRLAATIVVLLAGLSLSDATAQGLEPEEAEKLARQYLAAEDDETQAGLANELASYDGDIDRVLRALNTRTYKPVKAGYRPKEHFSLPALRERHPDDLLYFTVPKSYRPDRATGLIIFMHGGGAETGRKAPQWTMDFPEDDEEESDALGDVFDASGLIAVGPSAPWDEESYYRWCLPEADDYLADVILECKSRFHIDPDRVFLLGHSMGGFGAFHHVQRQPDRFVAVISNAGSWQLGHWPAIRGTRLCFINGVHDAEEGERWHYTDIAYARQTDELLSEQGLDYVYYEHEGGHSAHNGKPYIAKFLSSAQDLRREPCFWHIVLASPVGYSRYYSSEVKHNRWLTLDEAAEGQIEYDLLLADEDVEFDDWELEHDKRDRDGATIEARNLGDNTIEVTTQNVNRFTVWLHPKMVDFRRPVRITINGRKRFEKSVAPSLVTALESYQRRSDWGLIYPAKVELEVD